MTAKKIRFNFSTINLLKVLALLAGGILIAGCFITIYIQLSAQDSLYDSTDATPKNRVGLLLGTAKHLKNDAINPYYEFRENCSMLEK